MFRRRQTSAPVLPAVVVSVAPPSTHEQYNDEDAPMTPRQTIIMHQRALMVWLGMMYCILLVCRLGFGWTPGRAPPISIDMVPIPPRNVTIVTAYFDVPSKRPSSEYMPWIQRFLSLQDNMIIFTSNDQVPLFTKLRQKRPNTKVIGLKSLEETQMVKDFPAGFWQRQASLDPEKYLHSKELYIIWNEKGHFLEQAMELNPFQSEFFAWVDMGYLRDSLLEQQRMIRYLPKLLTRQQAIFLDVRPLLGHGEQYLGGGFIGGYKEGLSKWTTEYYKLLNANQDRFIGKDQPWMFETCVQHPTLCLWVEPRDTYGDAWFYMAPFMHGVSQYGTMDHLRRAWRSSRLALLSTYIMTRGERLHLAATLKTD